MKVKIEIFRVFCYHYINYLTFSAFLIKNIHPCFFLLLLRHNFYEPAGFGF